MSSGVVASSTQLEMLARVLNAYCKHVGIPEHNEERENIAIVVLSHNQIMPLAML